ncbi:MAG: tRNA (N(6)-L-threonylcarbamoyladenosine(37)-C(2))-methylthiotransferase MtaB [Desulfosoma sp.]
MRVALETLGCKVNQYESAAFLQGFARDGWQVVPFCQRADLYAVHSCTVTNKAAYQTRQLLRRALRTNPEARIAVIGCDAQIHWQQLARERLATHIIGTREKFHLQRWLKQEGTLDAPCCAVSDPRTEGALDPLPLTGLPSDRSRAFLKIQDGCDAFCTYCIVPFSRGCSRSLDAEAAIRQLESFALSGSNEVVLTGIHLGQWGLDLHPRTNLARLLMRINEARRPARIRLSSLESKEVDEDFLKVLAALPWICPHFHIPMQSGDAEILAAMGRPYGPDEYAETILALHRLFPRAALGADVIVGFPGETDRHFARTVRLVEALPLTYLHVFPYSPRPGTRASAMEGRIVGKALKERTRILRDLGRRKKRLFQERFVGSVLEVLVETSLGPGLWSGTSENYLTVIFQESRSTAAGNLVPVRIDRVTDSGLWGTPLG